MKVALINPAELEMSPYLRTYMEALEKARIDYDLIEWRRDIPSKEKKEHIISYNYSSSIRKRPIRKLMDYWRFACFAKSTIKSNKYNRIIVFEYQTALFLRRFLTKEYANNYILDVRDYSGRFKYIRSLVKPVDMNAYARVVSSPGYKEWTTPVKKEVVCHNTTIERLEIAEDIMASPFKNSTIILTNGVLRNYVMDKRVVDAFKGYNVHFWFAGKGKDSDYYQALSDNDENVEYTGYYKREDELSMAKKASFINIFLEETPCYNTAMSNRFYLSLIVGVPMIVNSQNVQSKYVTKYHLGIVADTPLDLPMRMEEFMSNFDINIYNKGRREVIAQIKDEILSFQHLLIDFVR